MEFCPLVSTAWLSFEKGPIDDGVRTQNAVAVPSHFQTAQPQTRRKVSEHRSKLCKWDNLLRVEIRTLPYRW